MCGIAGAVSSDLHERSDGRGSMLRMLGMLRHRGPDQFGIYDDGRAALGSARLSIIDVAGGQQPISNEDETLWIVLNGEIFNYVELRRDLEGCGHRFRTNTDTEVLLHLYEEYGRECLSLINGQYAFAIWNTRQRMLFAARDRLGVRPLFFTEAGGSFVFASEVKALLAWPGVKAELDATALRQVFTYWSPLPGRTMFKGVSELPAGSCLTYSNGALKVDRYWTMRFGSEGDGPGERHAVEQLRELLTDATRIRLRADVPVGAYLSGGLDSSLIAKITSDHMGSQVATFSIAFEDRAFDETEHQLHMASVLRTRHEVVHASFEDIARAFADVVWHTEVPLTRTAPVPMFFLSRLVRESGFKVVLTGEGADEFFAGYDLFKETVIRRFWARQPDSALRPRLLQRLYGDIPGLSSMSGDVLRAFFAWRLNEVDSPFYSHAIRWRNTARLHRFFTPEIAQDDDGADVLTPESLGLPAEFSGLGVLERAQSLEANVFLPQYLLSSQGDRVAMAHSVETRHPFLDYRVVEWANSLPARLKMKGLKDKYVLRRLGRELLPDGVWDRPKRPYRAPISRSFFAPQTREQALELLAPEQIRRTGIFRDAAVSRLVEKVQAVARASETDDMAIAGILSTQIWHRDFVERLRPVSPLTERDDIKECGSVYAASAS